MTFFSTSSRALKFAAASLALAGLAACASPFRADVSRFQTQLPAPQGQTFAIVADDPALAGGLEFAQYAGYVAQEMQQLGYVQASSPESATMLVRFDYGVDNGRERVRSDPFGYGYRDPFYRGWYDYRPIAYRDATAARASAICPTARGASATTIPSSAAAG